MSVEFPYSRRPLRRAPAHLIAVALALVFALAAASPARATSVGEKIILRCTHGESLAGFSQSAYNQALKDLSADSEEYSACSMEIRQAQIAALRGNGGAGGHGGAGSASGAGTVALPATPSEISSLARAKREGSGPVSVGTEVVHPGVVHADIASAFSTLPTPLLAVLALMLACVLVAAGSFLHKRVRSRHSD